MQLYGDQRARKTREKESVVSEARRRQKDRPLIDVDCQNCRRVDKERAAAAVIPRGACRAFAARSAYRDRARQPSDDVIFVGDDTSHERGPMFGFNGAGGGG